MHFDGIIYRIWAVSGVIVLIGLVILVLSRAPKERHDIRFGVFMILFGAGIALFLFSRIAFPSVEIDEGTYLYSERNSRAAPPLPFTDEYVFDFGRELKDSVYLDVFSRKKLFPEGFTEGQLYQVTYDSVTHVILDVEALD